MLNTEMCVDYVFKGLMIHNTCTYISQKITRCANSCRMMSGDVCHGQTYSTSMTQMNLRRVVTVTQGAGMVLLV